MSSPILTIRTAVDLGAASQMDALKSSVVSNTNEMANGFQRMGETAKRSSFEAQGAVRLLGEEVGVHMSRHISRFISQLPGVGTAMAAAFNVFAIVGVVEVLGQVVNKITEVWHAAEKNADAWRKIEQTARDANEKIEKEIDAQEKKYIELTQGPVAGLIFEIGHMRSVAIEAFKEIEKQMDEVQKQFAEEGGGMQWMIGMGSQARALAEDVKKTSLEIQDAQLKAQIGLPALKTPEKGKSLSAEDQAFNAEVLSRPFVAAEGVIRNKINEINKIPLADLSKDQREGIEKLQQTYLGLYAQLERQRTLQGDMVRDKATEEKVEVHKLGVGEGDERIAAQKRLDEAEIKLAEDTAIGKAQAIASADKLAALETGASKTKDLTQQQSYYQQIETLTIQSENAVTEARKDAANKRLDAELKANEDLRKLHNSGSEEDKKAVQKSLDEDKVLRVNHNDEMLRLDNEHDAKILAARIKFGNEVERINAERTQRDAKTAEEAFAGQLAKIDGQVKAVEAGAQRESAALQAKAKAHLITSQQELQGEQDINDKEYAAALALLKKKEEVVIQEQQFKAAQEGIALSRSQATQTKEFQDLLNQEQAVYEKYLTQRAKLTNDSLTQEQAQYQKYFNAFSGQFNSALNGWLQGQNTMRQSAVKMFNDVLRNLENFVEQWIEKKVEMWLMDELLGKTTQTITATGQITSSAAVAAANAFAATAAIPVIGPELAPAAAASALAEVMSFMAFASAQQGAILPNDMMILAHQNEMILPAPISRAVQNMTQSGGQGSSASSGDTHVHLHVTAMDSTDFDRVLQNNLSSIGRAVINSKKAGHIPASAIAH